MRSNEWFNFDHTNRKDEAQTANDSNKNGQTIWATKENYYRLINAQVILCHKQWTDRETEIQEPNTTAAHVKKKLSPWIIVIRKLIWHTHIFASTLSIKLIHSTFISQHMNRLNFKWFYPCSFSVVSCLNWCFFSSPSVSRHAKLPVDKAKHINKLEIVWRICVCALFCAIFLLCCVDHS